MIYLFADPSLFSELPFSIYNALKELTEQNGLQDYFSLTARMLYIELRNKLIIDGNKTTMQLQM